MGLALFPVVRSTRTARRRGRPAVTEDARERDKHIQVAMMRLCHGATTAETCAAFDISERSVRNYVARALSYDDPRSRYLRRISGRENVNEMSLKTMA